MCSNTRARISQKLYNSFHRCPIIRINTRLQLISRLSCSPRWKTYVIIPEWYFSKMQNISTWGSVNVKTETKRMHHASFILGNNLKNFSEKGKCFAFSKSDQENFVLGSHSCAFRKKLCRTINFLFYPVLSLICF